jgi:hypothetical protein
MAMINPHERDIAPSRYEDEHGSGCECDLCQESYEPDFDDTPSQADLDRRYLYFIQRERVGVL